MANPFTSISCSIRYDNARLITWTMMPGANYPEDFTLRVENSRAGGPWQVIAEGLQNSCAFVDSRKRNYNKTLDDYYRVRYQSASTGEDYVSPITEAGNHKAFPFSADAENIVKQVETQMNISGCTGKLLKKKVWGVHCPLCVDFAGQETVNEHCPRCLGTGIDGGFFPGIPLSIIKDSIETQEQPSQIGFLQGETVKGRCIAYPWINYGDVWCEDNTNKRYVVAQATPAASFKTTALVYSIVMNQVEYTDVMHSHEADERVVETGAWQSEEASNMPKHTGWDEVLSGL